MTMQQQPFFSLASSTGSGSRVVCGWDAAGSMGGASLGEGTRGPCGMVGVNLYAPPCSLALVSVFSRDGSGEADFLSLIHI